MTSSFLSQLAFFITVIAYSSCLNTYIVTFPKNIRPNLSNKIHVQILKATGPVNVDVEILDSKNQTVVTGSNIIQEGESGEIELQMPADIERDEYRLAVKGSGGLKFENSSSLDFVGKSYSIMIQTDRAMYKPGQTVHFRVFGMYPDLTLNKDLFDIDIYDPKKNRIAQWRNMTSKGGVVSDHMVMSSQPILGDWTIKVTQGRESREKTITVAEYVLPRFEVGIKLPPFALTDQKFVDVTVNANYTIGTPVKGSGILRIKKKFTMWWRKNEPGFTEHIDQPFKINGVHTLRVPLKDIKKIDPNLEWDDFTFEVNVTEGLTGKKMNASDELKFYSGAEKLEFTESLPNNFKPGLIYTAFLKAVQQDGTPIPSTFTRVAVNITYRYPIEEPEPEPSTLTPLKPEPQPPVDPMEPEIPPMPLELEPPPFVQRRIMPPMPFPPPQRYRTEDQPTRYFDVSPDGIIMFEIDIPEKVTQVMMNAQYKKERAYKDIDASKSPSNSFVQVRLLTTNPKAESDAIFEIRTTEPVRNVDYKILSKGMVIASGTFPMAGQKKIEFPVFLTTEMAPSAKMIVQYVRDDGEIVADGITFNIKGIFKNEVALSFDRTNAKPGEQTDLHLRAAPFSDIFLLAVDKSVLLLKSGNDITADEVTKELEGYDSNGFDFFPGMFRWHWPMPSGGADAEDVFRKNGLTVLTDANLYNHVEPWSRRRFPMPMRALGGVARRNMPMMMAPMKTSARSGPPKISEPKIKEQSVRVRKEFPETWLWSETSAGSRGETHLSVNVPDTMTSWIATAFAVHPDFGLGVGLSPASITVSQPFFLRINLPYSAVRDEVLLVQVDVFNYGIPTEWCLVIMDDTPTIHNLFREESSARKRGSWVKVPSGEVGSSYFPIIPREVGDFKIKVRGIMQGGVADAVERVLKVVPEGTPQEFNDPTLVDLTSGRPFQRMVPVDFPIDAVQGSKRVRVSAIGDIMGPSINGIENLLKMPYGCGEQNMLNFVPNIFVRKYLTVTGKITDAIITKSKEYMVKGYQRELTYQHTDGSFSAFGNSDKSGTTWLTAFVVKSFSEASEFIDIDEDNVLRAVQWLMAEQNENGTFNEPGKVLHKEMQGGSAGGETSLTAFVLIALLEASEVFPKVKSDNSTTEVIGRAEVFLENVITELSQTPSAEMDLYELAIVSYALSLTKSDKLPAVVDLLQRHATKKDGSIFWEKPGENTVDSFLSWRPPNVQANGINIEMTAYALLTLAAMKNTNDGVGVLRWLTSQRNPEGGFSSTQDTVVALQALADMAALIYSPNFDMKIDINALDRFGESIKKETLIINPGNALVLQAIDVPEATKQVDISATGHGMSLVEVATYFNTMRDLQKKAFDLDISLLDETSRGYLLKVCGRWTKEGSSGMTIMQIGYPTGVEPDMDSLNTAEAPEYKRSEISDRGLIIYLDEISGKPQCVSVYMSRVESVAKQKPVPVKIYDYYDTSKQVTDFYSSILSEVDMCDLCENGRLCECKNNAV